MVGLHQLGVGIELKYCDQFGGKSSHMAGGEFTAGDASVTQYHGVVVGDVVSEARVVVADKKNTILSRNYHDVSAST